MAVFAGGNGVEARHAGKERLLDCFTLRIRNGAVVNDDGGDVAFEEALHERRLRGVV
jgi:hypothetical protein